MKKCQMHNKKKKRQALLYCNAALFGCNWRLCLSFLSISMISGNGQLDELCRFSLQQRALAPGTVCSCGLAPAQRPRAQRAAGPGAAACHLHWWTPTRVPLHLHRGLGEAALILLQAAGPATAEQTLWTWSRRAQTSLVRERHTWCYETQQSSLPPTATDNSGAVLGKRTFQEPSHPSCCYSCASYNHPPQWEWTVEGIQEPLKWRGRYQTGDRGFPPIHEVTAATDWQVRDVPVLN